MVEQMMPQVAREFVKKLQDAGVIPQFVEHVIIELGPRDFVRIYCSYLADQRIMEVQPDVLLGAEVIVHGNNPGILWNPKDGIRT